MRCAFKCYYVLISNVDSVTVRFPKLKECNSLCYIKADFAKLVKYFPKSSNRPILQPGADLYHRRFTKNALDLTRATLYSQRRKTNASLDKRPPFNPHLHFAGVAVESLDCLQLESSAMHKFKLEIPY